MGNWCFLLLHSLSSLFIWVSRKAEGHIQAHHIYSRNYRTYFRYFYLFFFFAIEYWGGVIYTRKKKTFISPWQNALHIAKNNRLYFHNSYFTYYDPLNCCLALIHFSFHIHIWLQPTICRPYFHQELSQFQLSSQT